MYLLRDSAAPARSAISIRGYGSLRAQGRHLSTLTFLAPTEQTASQLLLPGRRLLLLFQPLLLPGVTAAVDAAGDRAEHAVMDGIVPGDAADRGALQAALGVGGFNRQRKGSDGEQGGNRFHGI